MTGLKEGYYLYQLKQISMLVPILRDVILSSTPEKQNESQEFYTYTMTLHNSRLVCRSRCYSVNRKVSTAIFVQEG